MYTEFQKRVLYRWGALGLGLTIISEVALSKSYCIHGSGYNGNYSNNGRMVAGSYVRGWPGVYSMSSSRNIFYL